MIPDLSTHNRPSSVTVHSRTFLRSLRTVAVAFLGALLALALVGPTQDQVGPLTLQYHIALRAEGGTTVNLPPLGNISFPTHLGPIHLEVTVLNVDITALTPDLIAAGKRTHVVTDDPPELASLALGPSGVESMKRELQHRLLRYAARIFIFAWIGSSSLLMLASYKP